MLFVTIFDLEMYHWEMSWVLVRHLNQYLRVQINNFALYHKLLNILCMKEFLFPYTEEWILKFVDFSLSKNR